MAQDHMNGDEIQRLRALSEAGSPPPWTAYVEGRNHSSGDSFISVGPIHDPDEDIYVSRDSGPASSADLDLIAEARTQLPRLLDEIERLRHLLGEGTADP